MAKSNLNKRKMGRIILNCIILCALASCTDTGDRKNIENSVFCVGDRWQIEKFVVEPFPAIVPFESNAIIIMLQNEYYDWKVASSDTLIVSNGQNKDIMLRYAIKQDTLLLFPGNEKRIQLLIKEKTKEKIALKMSGLYKASFQLKRSK